MIIQFYFHGMFDVVRQSTFSMSADVYSFAFQIMCVKDSLTHFLFLYSFRNGILFQLKLQNLN